MKNGLLGDYGQVLHWKFFLAKLQNTVGNSNSYVQNVFSSRTAGAVLRTDVSTLLGELVRYTSPWKLPWYKYPGKAFVLRTIHV